MTLNAILEDLFIKKLNMQLVFDNLKDPYYSFLLSIIKRRTFPDPFMNKINITGYLIELVVLKEWLQDQYNLYYEYSHPPSPTNSNINTNSNSHFPFHIHDYEKNKNSVKNKKFTNAIQSRKSINKMTFEEHLFHLLRGGNIDQAINYAILNKSYLAAVIEGARIMHSSESLNNQFVLSFESHSNSSHSTFSFPSHSYSHSSINLLYYSIFHGIPRISNVWERAILGALIGKSSPYILDISDDWYDVLWGFSIEKLEESIRKKRECQLDEFPPLNIGSSHGNDNLVLIKAVMERRKHPLESNLDPNNPKSLITLLLLLKNETEKDFNFNENSFKMETENEIQSIHNVKEDSHVKDGGIHSENDNEIHSENDNEIHSENDNEIHSENDNEIHSENDKFFESIQMDVKMNSDYDAIIEASLSQINNLECIFFLLEKMKGSQARALTLIFKRFDKHQVMKEIEKRQKSRENFMNFKEERGERGRGKYERKDQREYLCYLESLELLSRQDDDIEWLLMDKKLKPMAIKFINQKLRNKILYASVNSDKSGNLVNNMKKERGMEMKSGNNIKSSEMMEMGINDSNHRSMILFFTGNLIEIPLENQEFYNRNEELIKEYFYWQHYINGYRMFMGDWQVMARYSVEPNQNWKEEYIQKTVKLLDLFFEYFKIDYYGKHLERHYIQKKGSWEEIRNLRQKIFGN